MTPAPHGVTEIESYRAGTQQTNNRLVTSPCRSAVSLDEKYACFWPGRRRNMLLAYYHYYYYYYYYF